ncbi:hypothetical protein [Caulobacter rhizosphaerae]|uniref:hypothetical protein n=1 Tax=Caulobacter rhizosphaerae TaxID=2010972 RepID=UPI0013D6810C|nr:hypothetical protein [Caulobacter rhizosphaerae]GGL35612.1 hypothetical protein GCM10010983_35750 [Caulobacter rhizosphaerae]
MIKPTFLKAQMAKAAAGRTPPFLRRLTAGVVDRVATAHYGQAYAMKCLQTAHAVGEVLKRFGVGSQIWLGAFCAAEVFETSGFQGWGGFWGQDHHAWLYTANHELVDLSVAHMHRHPRASRKDGIPMPPVWWDDVSSWPPVLRYLPDSPAKIGFPDPRDAADLKMFMSLVMVELDRVLAEDEVDDVTFGPILSGLDAMDALTERGHPWLVRAIEFQDRGARFPLWIEQRHQELLAAWAGGYVAPSRLSQVDGLIGPAGA